MIKFPSGIGGEIMSVRELMQLAAGGKNFKILRCLHDKPMYSGELAERLSIDVRTVRSHLHRLRTNDLVTYETDGKKHIYYIKTPFETAVHEMIISLVALADPVRKRGEDPEPIPMEGVSPLLAQAQKEYWSTLIQGFFKLLQRQGSIRYQNQLQDELDRINRRIEDLQDEI
jgi:DNA-binding transcriptional ArsR family regulator